MACAEAGSTGSEKSRKPIFSHQLKELVERLYLKVENKNLEGWGQVAKKEWSRRNPKNIHGVDIDGGGA